MPTALLAEKVHSPDAAGAIANQARPEVTIPAGPLGYLTPGEMPVFYYYALVELHFLDANHLLFAFNVPALLKRDDNCPASDTQRMVRAVVLQLPSGQVLKQVDWELYDFADFLWGLREGQLLLRRCTQLDLLGADLQPHPFIETTGAIEDVGFSPDRSVMVVEEKVTPDTGTQESGTTPSILEQGIQAPRTRVTFIRIRPLQAIARAVVPLPGDIPATAHGVFETLAAPHDQWVVNFQAFHGPQQAIATVHSFCSPVIQAITDTLFMVTTCSKANEKIYQGYDLKGAFLWQIPLREDQFAPRLILVPNGAHFAVESLHLKRPHAALDPLTKDDIDGEDIDIYDSLTGVRIATFHTTPVYTGGRNVDFSPDGTRMAVLHNGAIEIYAFNELVKARQGAPR
ncbi:MAG: hypothetical protein ACLQMO_05465 [Acidobacteriaceae bacterium]